MINANNQAFPGSSIQGGLTKREYLAGKVMQAMVSSIDSEANYLRMKRHGDALGLSVSQWIAKESVKQANALLAELEVQ